MLNFEELLASSAKAHGHLCPGQAVGVRMAMLGCRLIGLDNPTEHLQIKKLLVYVEMDRCAADAIAHVTGVKLGRRSLNELGNECGLSSPLHRRSPRPCTSLLARHQRKSRPAARSLPAHAGQCSVSRSAGPCPPPRLRSSRADPVQGDLLQMRADREGPA